jgi:predicted dehydrogenase
MASGNASGTVRWGILGTAKIAAGALIPAIKASRNGVVAAVASRDAAKAQEFADKHGIARVHGSYEALLADPGIDAIYNPLPGHLHAPWCLKAAAAGKPTLCEKPLTCDAAEADKLVNMFQEKGVLLAEALMYRYHPMTRRVHEIVRSGQLGELRMVHAQFNCTIADPADFRFHRDTGGGALLDVGSYCVSVMRLLAGTEPDAVTAAAVVNEFGADLQMTGTLSFPGGVLGHFGCGMQSQFDCSYGASGSLGRVLVDSGAMCAWPGTDFTIKLWRGEAYEEIVVPAANHYQLLVEDFGDALLTGKPMDHTLEDTVSNLRVIDRLFAAAGMPSGG